MMKLDITNTQAEALCKKYKMEVTNDTDRANKVLTKMMHNVMEFGVPYCPCQSSHNADTICPCRFMRDAGACRCGLYVKKEVNNANGQIE